ncbi:hypothetical protein [Morganella psychrotolerans]|uniref:Uncharacterized protein n=1 Tax=Morganella psychrotolerans TaxID=368603 RepID=A0A1B8HA31_9GAMM|nr:hypothetical protein [Morganella psychrotolerans]OBU05936.1 hypothetical protein AYY17_06260 [Morganella psychrotolerans]
MSAVVNGLIRKTGILALCGLLSGCGVFYGAMCGSMTLFTPSESVTKIPVPDATVAQPYDQIIEVAPHSGMIPFDVTGKPEWMIVTLLSKNNAGEWIPLITEEEWQTRVMKAEERPLIAARLQGTPPERGNVRVNIKGTSYRTMCGTSDPVYSLRFKVRE